MNLETKFCDNCQKLIAESNYLLHLLHCQKYTVICDECLETFPRTQLVQHKEEQHAIIHCKKCNQKVQQWKLEDHELNICVWRPIPCQYCEIEVPWQNIKNHEDYCGARTELCNKCKNYVRIKDSQSHQCLKKTSDETIVCHSCHIQMKLSAYEAHSNLCSGYSRLKDFMKNTDTIVNRNLLSSVDGAKSDVANMQKSSDESKVEAIATSSSKVLTFHNAIGYENDDEETEDCMEVPDTMVNWTNLSSINGATSDVTHLRKSSDETKMEEIISSMSKMLMSHDAKEHEHDDVQTKCNGKIEHGVVGQSSSQIQALGKHPRGCRNTCNTCGVVYFAISDDTENCEKCRVWSNQSISDKSSAAETCKKGDSTFVAPLSVPKSFQAKHTYGNPTIGAFQSSDDSGTGFQSQEIVPEAIPVTCPLCSKLYPVSKLSDHVKLCSEIKMFCPICAKEIRILEKQQHIPQCIIEHGEQLTNEKPVFGKQQKTKMETLKRPIQPERQLRYKNAQCDLLPCEFCEKLFPAYLLIEHQSSCRPDLLHFPTPNENTLSPEMIEHKDIENVLKSKVPHSTGGSKRGRQEHSYYQGGKNAEVGEFLPEMQYAGYPEAYRIYDAAHQIYYFGSVASSTKRAAKHHQTEPALSRAAKSYAAAAASPSDIVQNIDKGNDELSKVIENTEDSEDDESMFVICPTEFSNEHEEAVKPAAVKVHEYKKPAGTKSSSSPGHKHLSKKKKKKGKRR